MKQGPLLLATGVGLALGAAILSSVSKSAVVSKPVPMPADSRRILLIGDSLAVGLNAPLRALATAAGVAAYAGRGIVGTRIDQWATDSWLTSELFTFRPNLVLVSLGTNDEKVGTGFAAKVAPKLRSLVAKIQATPADVAWIGPPSLPFPLTGVVDLIRSTVPHYFPSETLVIPRYGDKLHPTADGYSLWASAIWNWLST